MAAVAVVQVNGVPLLAEMARIIWAVAVVAMQYLVVAQDKEVAVLLCLIIPPLLAP